MEAKKKAGMAKSVLSFIIDKLSSLLAKARDYELGMLSNCFKELERAARSGSGAKSSCGLPLAGWMEIGCCSALSKLDVDRSEATLSLE